MVQFRKPLEGIHIRILVKEHWQNGYWHLERLGTDEETIRVVKAAVPSIENSKLSANRAEQLHERIQRGLLIYETCTNDELRAFCIARDTDFASSSRGRKAMINSLERADEIPFDRFMDLPPELREQVYTHHFESLTTKNAFPHEPPLTLVSGLIRHESLPLFYKICDFRIDWAIDSLEDAPETLFTRVRDLTIAVHVHGIVSTDWEVRISSNGTVSAKLVDPLAGTEDACYTREKLSKTREVIDERAKEWSAVLHGRDGKLKREDHMALAKLIQPVFRYS